METPELDAGQGLRVERFGPQHRAAFDRLHDAACGGAGCYCAAWWTDDWESWSARRPEENAALRDTLAARGEYDGYLAFRETLEPSEAARSDPGTAAAPPGSTASVPDAAFEPAVGWCQVGPRDRLAKLVRQFALEPAPETWAVTCFLVPPPCRGRGVARALLRAVLSDLTERGIRRVEAFPRRARPDGPAPDALDLWNGPEPLFVASGFRVVRDDPLRPVLALDL